LKALEIGTAVGDCRIIFDGALEDAERLRPYGTAAIVTDTTVRRLFGHRFPGLPVVEIEPGEGSKDLRTVERVHLEFLGLELDRSSFVVAIGGGVVCDLAGFAASTYMRGVRFGFVPTTLLAQADAAIGGKNGVNVGGMKNIAGLFRQPEFVLIDISLLETLPVRERLCGLAEIVKHALIASADLFAFLESEDAPLLSLDRRVVTRALEESLRIKSGFVRADTLESGERRKLNFGHTLGHALEKTAGLPHGEAVSLGMVAAARISAARGKLSAGSVERISGLLERAGLPVGLPIAPEKLFEALRRDKKRQGDSLHLVLLSAIGRAEIVRMTYGELEGYVDDLCQSR
jgi:3-dehydroquinate synthase